jgi:putative ABC transport system substrate-binding protein
MISRRGFAFAALGAGALPLAAQIQPAGKVYRIGWLAPAPVPSTLEGFRAGLRALGYVEGNNFVIVERYAIGPEQLAGLAAELVAARVDVLMVSSNTAARAAKNTAGAAPVVFVSGGPVEAGLVLSLARPGGNLTGLSVMGVGLEAKRLQLLKETFPSLSHVGVLTTSTVRQSVITELEAAARSLGLEMTRLEVRVADDLEPALAAAANHRAGAILPMSSPLFAAEKHRIVTLATKHRLAAMYEHRDFTEAGGLMSYGPDIFDVFRRAAGYVDKILKGARPADLAVEQPTKVELVINLKTARALGLTIPQSLLLRADEVIQ